MVHRQAREIAGQLETCSNGTALAALAKDVMNGCPKCHPLRPWLGGDLELCSASYQGGDTGAQLKGVTTILMMAHDKEG